MTEAAEDEIVEDEVENQIPQSRFDEATGKLKDKVRDLEGQLEQARVPPPETPRETPKQSRAQLLDLVDEGSLTQAQADTIWEDQLRKDILAEARQEVSTSRIADNINKEMDRYVELIPDIEVAGSDDRKKVQAEYRELVRFGSPAGLTTELAALRAVYGPVSKIKKSKADVETHQETVSGGEPEVKENPLKLNARTKAYYEKRIDMGLYKDWDEVKEELKYKK